MNDHLVELRGEVLREHVDVLDAVVQATPGASRMSVLRWILGDWVDAKRHEATLVLRVCPGKGSGTESDRSHGGSRPGVRR